MASRNEEIVRRWLEQGFSSGDLSVADTVFAEDFVNHTALPGQARGRDGFKRALVTLRAAFPDLKIRIDDLVCEGDRVAVRDEISGVHSGEFNGVKPTGRRVVVGRISFYKLVNGLITEHWAQLDMAGLMRQLTSPTA